MSRLIDCPTGRINRRRYETVYAHLKATHIGIKRKSPAHGSVCLFLRSEKAHKILIVARRDDERMMREPGFLHDPINLGLTGKVGNVEPAAADRFYIWQR